MCQNEQLTRERDGALTMIRWRGVPESRAKSLQGALDVLLTRMDKEIRLSRGERDEQMQKIERLRAAIEKAPCPIPSVDTGGPNCIGLRGCEKEPPACNCWKSEVIL